MRTAPDTLSVALALEDPTLLRRAEWALECLLAPLDVRWRLVDPPRADGDPRPDLGYGCEGSVYTLEHEPAAWASGRIPPERDVLARTFWFLARVEELAASEARDIEAFDEHGRFRADASALAGTEPTRTPVDRHVEELATALDARRAPWPNEHAFAVALTHDIDLPLQWNAQGVRRAQRAARAALRRADVTTAARLLGNVAVAPVRRLRGTDPFLNALWIGIHEAHYGARSTSYLIAGHHAPADGHGPSYDRVRARVARDVLDSGGAVGLHGSYTSSVTPDRLAAERARLEGEVATVRTAAPPVVDHRFHYLRHLPHLAWPELDAAGFRSDASLGFAEHPGFRSGSSHPYRAWSHADDRPLDLVVVPLALMDATLEPRYLDSLAAGPEIAAELFAHGARHGSAFSLLWHNDKLLPDGPAAPWNRLYWRLLDDAAEADAWLTDTGSIADHWRAHLTAQRRA